MDEDEDADLDDAVSWVVGVVVALAFAALVAVVGAYK